MPVGKRLSAERHKSGLSIVDIERITRIGRRSLQALEEEDWAHLPAVPYVKGYIQSYAKALNLDPLPLVREYERDISRASEQQDEAQPLGRIPARTVVPRQREAQGVSKKAWRSILAALIIVLLGIWVVSLFTGNDTAVTPIAPAVTGTIESTATSSSASSPDTATLDETTTASNQADDETDTSFKFTIQVEPEESSWLRVTVDGTVVFEDTLAGGIQKQWDATTEALIRIGNPSVVTITQDGKAVDVPQSGGIAEVTLNASTSASE